MWYIYEWGNKIQEPRVRTQLTLNPKLLLKYKILDLPSFYYPFTFCVPWGALYCGTSRMHCFCHFYTLLIARKDFIIFPPLLAHFYFLRVSVKGSENLFAAHASWVWSLKQEVWFRLCIRLNLLERHLHP